MIETYAEALEILLGYYTRPRYEEEVHEAKRQFFENAGVVDEESEYFELRMSQFLDWYILTREFSSLRVSPIANAIADPDGKVQDIAPETLKNLLEHRHSLFEFTKIKGEDVYLKDLFANQKIVVRKSPWTMGFSPEEVFEARLIPHEDSFVFTKGICFHPSDAKKVIVKSAKKARKEEKKIQQDLMLRLMKMRYRFEQYRHVKIDKIYSIDILKEVGIG